jgi:hypothetical protein
LSLIIQIKIFHIHMVYDGFCCYVFSICQVDCQGDLVVYFTMPKEILFLILLEFSIMYMQCHKRLFQKYWIWDIEILNIINNYRVNEKPFPYLLYFKELEITSYDLLLGWYLNATCQLRCFNF